MRLDGFLIFVVIIFGCYVSLNDGKYTINENSAVNGDCIRTFIYTIYVFEEYNLNLNPILAATCLKPAEVTETGRGIGDRIQALSWTNMKQYLREQRSTLNLTMVEQRDCQSEFMEGFRDALGGGDSWNYSFYKPTVDRWFNREKDEPFKPYFTFGGYGY